jgi:hypothetical protein
VAIAFEPMILYITLGIAGVIALARLLLGWALHSS